MGYGAHRERQKSRALAAATLMSTKNCIVTVSDELDRTTFKFQFANIIDSDLASFKPAFNGYGPSYIRSSVLMYLAGSPVSEKALADFASVVPRCEFRR
ncbi:MAG: hypothetical protein C0485_03700 [Pirellula sp.]|nr:hypothetical protein [Pirellula sp.]